MRFVQRHQRGVDRLHGRIDQRRRLRGAALEPPQRRGQQRHRRLRPGDAIERRAQILGDFFGLHHAGAPLGERGLLAGLRRQTGQLINGMAQPLGLALGARHLGTMLRDGGFARAAFVPQPRHRGGVSLESRIGIEQRTMRRRIDEGALVMLAVDFHESRAKRAQHLHGDRLIVDEGPRPAVGELHAAHDQRIVAIEFVVGKNAARRVVRRKLEGGSDLTVLGAGAHQRRVAAGAERQRKGVEQDRFAGAGLAGKRGKSRAEIDVQPVDQNDVAN